MENRRSLGRSGDPRLHGCGYKMLALSGIKSGLCPLKGWSNLRFRICWLYQRRHYGFSTKTEWRNLPKICARLLFCNSAPFTNMESKTYHPLVTTPWTHNSSQHPMPVFAKVEQSNGSFCGSPCIPYHFVTPRTSDKRRSRNFLQESTWNSRFPVTLV